MIVECTVPLTNIVNAEAVYNAAISLHFQEQIEEMVSQATRERR